MPCAQHTWCCRNHGYCMSPAAWVRLCRWPSPRAAMLQLQEVRDDALQMLSVLAERRWQKGTGGGASYVAEQAPGLLLPGSPGADAGAAVMGSLQESFHHFQLRLSVKLARRALPGVMFTAQELWILGPKPPDSLPNC